ncbi:hypothetical protein BU23DRAFT_568155 [Bimuria novae-zelandiae CBS 107.79]|uniref:Uncharacterized protein n=1 Tax=Bimuria novae-zelandiae CBS 107.79 TaxID=1447943 RepID=A0A6A5VJA5_9PLEO|nr:hypothetical protein BU23DRAFT_568155 [Bimuria novae-zelandiae CBS 107.79]
MPPHQEQAPELARVMEGCKNKRPSKHQHLHNFTVDYPNGTLSPNDLAASTIGALRLFSALAEERGQHDLAEKALHLADVHQAVGEKLMNAGIHRMEHKVDDRAGILGWYLCRAAKLDKQIDAYGGEDGEKKMVSDVTQRVGELLWRTRARVYGNDEENAAAEMMDTGAEAPAESELEQTTPGADAKAGELSQKLQHLGVSDNREAEAASTMQASENDRPGTNLATSFDQTLVILGNNESNPDDDDNDSDMTLL